MKRLLLVGWDAADWKIADPLIARGEMPNLAQLISQGVRGNLATIYPPLSPMLWTSIATGKRAYKHGIHGFTEPAEDGLTIRPISNLGRTTKAFWNILNQNGKRCLVVGWWPSHPAEPIRGAMVSDRFPLSTSDDPGQPMLAGTVWPPELGGELADLRVHGIEITGEMLRMFVPEFEKVYQQNDKSLHDLAGVIAETLSIHNAATELMESQDWDVAAIYYLGIDHFSHRFMPYHAGRSQTKDRSPKELFSGVVANAYRWHDVMLGRLVELAGDDCGVMLMSDHGFHSDRLLPEYIPAEAAGPAVEHRHFGIFCMRAPGVSQGKEIYGASVLDVAPTVLHLCGIPAGVDMDGKVLIHAFDRPAALPPIPSWDEVAGEDGRHEPWRQYDSVSAVAALDQLVNLGYIAPPDQDARKTVARTIQENRYDLGRAYLDAGKAAEAAEIFSELVGEDPEQGRYYLHLFESRFLERDFEACHQVLNRFDAACEQFAAKATDELDRRRAEVADDDLPLTPLNKPATAEFHERRRLAEKDAGFGLERMVARVRVMLATAETAEEREKTHEFLQQQVEPWAEYHPELPMFLATAFATARDFPRSLEYIAGIRRVDADHYRAMALEARVHQAMGNHQECVESALDSLSLVYFQPALHHHMAISLLHLGEEEKAEHSFRVAISQMPGLMDAHLELARILRKNPARAGDAGWHQAQANLLRAQAKLPREAVSMEADRGLVLTEAQGLDRWDGQPPSDRSKVITIVSGLPRSGTSMMMQLLSAAGIQPYTDGVRAPDEDNPRGYFEHDRATRVHEDSSWMPEARGRVVKIVGQLLPRLPATEEYRIVFMHRHLEEVVASQRAMLDRLGRKAHRSPEDLAKVYAGQLVRIQQWLQRANGVQAIAVSYADALGDPGGVASRLAQFLGEPFDAVRAAAAVEPSLRRQAVADSVA